MHSPTTAFRFLPRSAWRWVGALALVLSVSGARAQWVTQTMTLAPGWNAVWLEVQPTNNAIEAVFGGLPLESVWTYQSRLSSVQFIEDPSEPVWNRSSWRVYIPTHRVESFQNNLFAAHANRAYLVHITNSTPVTWSVTGRPSVRPLEWVPDALNLVGFPVDPAMAPPFAEFFAGIRAHSDPETGQPRKIYRLQPSGAWTLVAGNELMERNVAYWVMSEGPSTFTAPLELTLPMSDGLDFGGTAGEFTIRLRNVSPSGGLATLTDQTFPSLLSYYRFSTNNAEIWPALPADLDIELASAEFRDLRLAIRRKDFTSVEHASIVEVRSDSGTLYRLPVSARAGAGFAGTFGVSPAEEARGHAGLWVGMVSLGAVAEVNSGIVETNPVTREITRTGTNPNPTPVRTPLDFRILLHVDTNGVTRLLKEVIQMWRDGTYTNDPSGLKRVAEPGRMVLLTDSSLTLPYRGVALRAGVPVGRRISTLGYDFDGGTNNFLELSGFFAVSNSISGSLALPSTAPSNPFRHKYHPDHDNLDATFRAFSEEAYAITRDIELEFLGDDPEGFSDPDYGYSVIAGNYREVISGLHKDAIHVSGVFRLRRVAMTGVLNE
jgi:hypothetical protein